MRNLPALVDATVVAQDPDQYRLYVSIDAWGGQIPALSVDVLTQGPRDAVRGNWPALPLPGTRGIVAFTRGDDRTGRWMGATAPALHDSSTLTPSHGNASYEAEYAGGWSWTGADGTLARALADGSTILLGPALPVPTRHVVAPDGSRQSAVFTAAQRRPAGPVAPFPVHIAFGNGAVFSVSASGDISAVAPAGQSVTLAVSGESSLTLASGQVTIDGASQPFTLSANGATVTLNTDGSISLTPAAGKALTTSTGGTAQAVRLADGSLSTVLRAQ